MPAVRRVVDSGLSRLEIGKCAASRYPAPRRTLDSGPASGRACLKGLRSPYTEQERRNWLETPHEPGSGSGLRFFSNGRMELAEDRRASLDLTNDQADLVQAIGQSLTAYVDALAQLMAGKYAHLRNTLPSYLLNPGNVTAIVCEDTVLVRFQSAGEPRGVVCGWAPGSIYELAPVVSQNSVYCHKSAATVTQHDETRGFPFSLQKFTAATGSVDEIAGGRLAFNVIVEHPPVMPAPPLKPY